MRGIGAITRSPPSAFSTSLAECGRNGAIIVFRSVTAWASTCRIVSRRSRSSSALSLNGSVSETYRLASPTRRITSAIAARWRWVSISLPTVPKPSRIAPSSFSSIGSSSPAAGISPTFLAIIAAVRLTRLPQPATSSLLVRETKSTQVKSASWFSGPAAEMK